MYKILICDDQKIVCEGLQTIINDDPDLQVVGMVHNGKEALDAIPDLLPELILMDLKMPEMNGVLEENQRKISKNICPDLNHI